MCPYYPAKEGLARLTIAEVTEWELEMRVERKRAVCGGRGGKGCCWVEKSSKTTTHYPKIESIQSAHKHAHQVFTLTSSHILYTTFVCVLCLRYWALLIYGTLQVPWQRCRALQFMSNLVNILSPVRPVSHCFSLFSILFHLHFPPRLLSSPSSSGDKLNRVWI